MIAQFEATTDTVLDPAPVHAAVTPAVLSGNYKRAEALARVARHIEQERWKDAHRRRLTNRHYHHAIPRSA